MPKYQEQPARPAALEAIINLSEGRIARTGGE